uniref:C2H2-type domain-containing protein n=1 Tax=viral metagenome TaxID=1070528 RepID=A0A6C0E4J8_9ZZZZ
MICEYCKNDYYDKSTLKKHQKTSKFCIKIQIEKNESININKFICNFCNKELSTKQSLDRHIKVCKSKKIMKIMK